MNRNQPISPNFLSSFGCLLLFGAFVLLCLMPIFFVQAMEQALLRLHLSPQIAGVAVLGILIGGLINLPIYHIERKEEQVTDLAAVFGISGWLPQTRRFRRDTLIAVNVGGCVIPLALCAWQVRFVLEGGGYPVTAMLIAVAANVAVCYSIARPVGGIGIMMPGFTAPAVALLATWILLGPEEYVAVRAPVAFTAGVLGPLIGADLLHLKDITKVSVGMLSIGGAGTFDGIVLSGLFAALLA